MVKYLSIPLDSDSEVYESLNYPLPVWLINQVFSNYPGLNGPICFLLLSILFSIVKVF